MTTLSLTEALEVYRQSPLDDGEALLLLPEDAVCLELGPVPDPASAGRLLAGVTGGTVLFAVARRGRRPHPGDLLLWTALCAALDREGRTLLPLEVLPAA